MTVHAGAEVWASSRSKGRWSRGHSRSSAGAPRSAARLAASDASSSSRSAARSRMRRGSTRRTRASGRAGRTGRARRRSATAATTPCPRRRRPRPAAPTAPGPTARPRPGSAARARTSSVGSSSRQGKISTHSTSPVERWSVTEKRGEAVDLVAPQVDAHRGRRRWTGTRRRSSPAGPPLPGARPAPPAGSRPRPGARPGRWGRRGRPGWIDDRLDVLHVRAQALDERPHRAPPAPGACAAGSRRRHMVRSRRPMVSTLGLTRSNGSVSQAGKRSTSSAPRKARRSWARRSASVLVGTATTSGWRPLSPARPAMVKARAGSGTASTADDAPASPARAGWRRRRGRGGRAGSPDEGTGGSLPIRRGGSDDASPGRADEDHILPVIRRNSEMTVSSNGRPTGR